MATLKLVPDWRRSWRWISVHALAITGALPGVWLTLPDDWRSTVPAAWLAGVTVITAVAGIYGRLVQQPIKIVEENR